jgi:hypothetical protein
LIVKTNIILAYLTSPAARIDVRRLFYSLLSTYYEINFELARSLKTEKASGDGRCQPNEGPEKTMSDHDYRYPPRSDSGRFGRWLSTRSAETWMFFAAGVFLGGFFF